MLVGQNAMTNSADPDETASSVSSWFTILTSILLISSQKPILFGTRKSKVEI